MISECKMALGGMYTAVGENPDKSALAGLDGMIEDMAIMNVVYIVESAMQLRDDYVKALK